MHRRGLITGLLVLPALRSARAQRAGKQYRLAYFHVVERPSNLTVDSTNPNIRAFFRELRTLGLVEGQNLVVDRYSAEGELSRIPGIARRIVETRPDVFVGLNEFIRILVREGATFPIVGILADPVAWGLVASLARSGNNITGVTLDAGPRLFGKHIELLKEINPRIARLSFLNDVIGADARGGLQEAAARLGVSVVGPLHEPPFSEESFRRTFEGFVESKTEAVIVNFSSTNFANRKIVVDQLIQRKLPGIGTFIELARLGALAAYAADFEEAFRNAARYVDRILKGSDPAQMPILQPTKWVLAINLKAAKALDLNVPERLLATADEVIE